MFFMDRPRLSISNVLFSTQTTVYVQTTFPVSLLQFSKKLVRTVPPPSWLGRTFVYVCGAFWHIPTPVDPTQHALVFM